MIKLGGTVLIWGGCTLWGFLAAEGVRRRVRLLEDIGQALEVLERELALNRTALPELLERMSHRTTQQGKQLFCLCRETLEKGNSFTYSWGAALAQSALKQEDRALLSCLSQVLGRYDAQGQERSLARLRGELERRVARGREEARALGRVYAILGVTAGGFLTLTLL